MKIFNQPKKQDNRARFNRLFARLVILYPLLIAAIYLFFIAQDRYSSISQVAVKKSGSSPDSSLNIGLLSLSSSPSSEDALYLRKYIESWSMLDYLEKQIEFRSAFADSGWDILYGLPMRITKESMLRYYQNRIHVNFDDKSGLLSIETEGFTPKFALEFNLAILKESERFINELSHKIMREQMAFAEEEVHEAYLKLTKSKDAVLQYQNQYGFLDPISQAESISRMIVDMETQKAHLETELRNQLTYLKENTPQIVSAKNTLASLNKQIEQERAKVTASKGKQLNILASQFQLLKGQLDFDTSVYTTAMSAAEKTRIETLRKVKVLSVIVVPQLPEDPTYPYRIYFLLSLLIGSFLLYGTLRLILSVIEDHRD